MAPQTPQAFAAARRSRAAALSPASLESRFIAPTAPRPHAFAATGRAVSLRWHPLGQAIHTDLMLTNSRMPYSESSRP